MAIQVFRDPDKLTQHHFIGVSGALLDPHDRTPVDAVTGTSFLFLTEGKRIGPVHFSEGWWKAPSLKDFLSVTQKNIETELTRDKSKDGFYGIDATKTTIILNGHGQRAPGVTVAGNLLAHEQIHYDIYFLVARAAIRAIEALAEASEATFLRKADALWSARLVNANCQNDMIQRAYDVQTRHGTDRTFQPLWATWVNQSLSQAEPFAIGAHIL